MMAPDCPPKTLAPAQCLVVDSHSNCGHLQRESGTVFPRSPIEAHHGPRIWVAEGLQRWELVA